MSKRRYNPRLAKLHHSYDVGEAAALYGIHKNTVRKWIKDGLPVVDDRRPTLILGSALRDYVHAMRTQRKQKCQPGELFCFYCRAPRRPAGNMADFELETVATGNLTALCIECETIMHQRINITKVKRLSEQMDITFTQAQKRIDDSN